MVSQVMASHNMPSSSMNYKADSDVATVVNYGVALYSSWSKSICIPKMGSTRNRIRLKTIGLYKANTLNGREQASWHLGASMDAVKALPFSHPFL